MGLGDAVEAALSAVGVDAAEVEAWLGRPCGCEERREKLNDLGRWAAAFARRGWAGARSALSAVLADQ